MSMHEVAIHEDTARRISAVLSTFLSESAAADVLLIDRSGQLLAQGDTTRALDTMSLCALAAGAFSSTAAMARLLGEPEFTMLFHQGIKENIHVTAVNEDAILLATFDGRTTVGMVRLFAKEASAAIGAILMEARGRGVRVGALEGPLRTDEARAMFRERSA
ncbi:MAG TPA: roadblock/LC7 domain-containing protein [Candidatus Methylomirabilis sp.]|nr:roadblock/LC7 domain-containing protein [Candidatus Methylomirabilis sp.]